MNLQNSRAWWAGFVVLPVLFLLLVPATRSQTGARVANANLNYLVENAQTIVRGNVVSAVLEPHPQFANLQTVLVTKLCSGGSRREGRLAMSWPALEQEALGVPKMFR
jgi:hypothetical protein